MAQQPKAIVRAWLLAVSAIALNACGGGGGDSGDGQGNNGGGFTLSTNSVTMVGKIQTSAPASQQILVHLTETGTASVAAGYRQGVTPPNWLSVGASGSGTEYMFVLSITDQGMTMPLGTYTTTLTIATNNSAGSTLQARDVQVTFTLRDGLRVSGVATAFTTAGTSPATQTLPFTVLSPAGINWTATSSVPWIAPPGGTQTGPGTFNVTFDNTGLRADVNVNYQGTVTLTNAQDSTDTAVLNVLFIVQAPGLGIGHAVPGTSGAATLGGRSGLEMQSIPLRITLGTGANQFPWTATLTTSSGGNWLTADVTSGMVSEAGAVIVVNADRASMPRGEYQGQLQVTANVNGGLVHASNPVTLRVEDDRLVVESNGVAFSSFPSRSVLQRTLRVTDSWRLSTVAWQSADQSWLTVTPGGTTDGNLDLTANPAGLADGQYTATVTVTSSNARIVNQETVRVGLTVRGTDPVAVIDQPVSSGVIAVNPVEPEVFVRNQNGDAVTAYDLYSGALLRTFAVPNCSGLLMSGDGRTLFVINQSLNTSVHALDPTSGATQADYDVNATSVASMIYARPDGHPVLLSNGETVDLISGERIPQGLVTSSPFAISRDQGTIYTRDAFDHRAMYAHRVRYSPLADPRMLFELPATNTGQAPTEDRGFVSDLALSSDDASVFVAASTPAQFDVLDPADMTLGGMLPGASIPNNVESSWNGLVVAGVASDPAAGDLWVYDSTGVERARLDSGTGFLYDDRVKVSGDGTRVISDSTAGLRIQNAPVP